MAVLPILTGDHPLLRRQAKKVGKVDRSIQTLLDDMLETMRVAPGIGLAANQVGRLLRLLSIEVEDTAVACLRFAPGALGVIQATTRVHPGLPKTVPIHGDTGSAGNHNDDTLRRA